MTRPIKFRARDRKKKEWVYLEIGKTHVDCYLEGGVQDGTDLKDRHGDLTAWQQLTGLLDKNSKEIYEGDVVEIKNLGRTEVKWEEQGWLPIVGKDTEWEVIGNIYENPELLKS